METGAFGAAWAELGEAFQHCMALAHEPCVAQGLAVGSGAHR
jgi:hypothetical protein